VLTVSVMAGGPAGGTGTQYFVGSFDGTTFTCDDPAESVRWVDHGADFYAPQSWSGVPDGRQVWVAWMSNWDYALTTPASTWRGAMTVPRELCLRERHGRVELAQRPVAELASHGRVVLDRDDLLLWPGDRWEVGAAPAAYDLDLRLEPSAGATAVELAVHAGAGPATRVRCLPGRGVLQVERALDGIEGTDLVAVQEVPLDLSGGVLDLRVVVDTCSVEVFADDGRVVLTNEVFPAPGSRGLTLTAAGAAVSLPRLVLRDLTRT
jgi:fructan beta-fructosidase